MLRPATAPERYGFRGHRVQQRPAAIMAARRLDGLLQACLPTACNRSPPDLYCRAQGVVPQVGYPEALMRHALAWPACAQVAGGKVEGEFASTVEAEPSRMHSFTSSIFFLRESSPGGGGRDAPG